ncbi:MAG: hypothetical protein WAL55_13700, partial [Candidatus Acidiferrales bacterium]
ASRNERRSLSLIDQAMMNGVESKFEPIGNAEFIENIVQMVFNCLFANEKLFADFAIAKALSNELNNLLFAVTEQWFVAVLASFRGTLGLLPEGARSIPKRNALRK